MPTVSVITQNQTVSIDINEGETIYDAADRQGLSLPHGCLSGSCGACRVKVVSGHENIKKESYVEKNTIENIIDHMNASGQKTDGLIIRLTCRSKIEQGDVTIETL